LGWRAGLETNAMEYGTNSIIGNKSSENVKIFANDTNESKLRKVKVKLSLCLTKHHATKTYWGMKV
jgi:hypothetical protein